MAAPNLVALTSIYPRGSTITPANTTSNELVPAPSAGHVYKINSLVVANIDGSSAVSATVYLKLTTGTEVALASTVSVPANSSLVVIGKDNPVYLTDTTGSANSITVKSSAINKLSFSCSYDEIY